MSEADKTENEQRRRDPLEALPPKPSAPQIIFPENLPPAPKKSRVGVIAIVGAAVLVAGAVFSLRFLAPAGVSAASDTSAVGQPRSQPVIQTRLSPTVIIEVVPAGAEEPNHADFVAFIESLPDVPSEKQMRETEFRDAARQLKLQAILTGPTPAANVNQRTVGLGGIIEVPAGGAHGRVRFRVDSISDDGRVTLAAVDATHDLRIETTLEMNPAGR